MIFAVIVTVCYAIYYAVNIMLDLHKKKDVESEKEEEFISLEGMSEEKSRIVEMTDEGFHVEGTPGDGDGQDWSGPLSVTGDTVPDGTPPPLLDATGAPLTEAERKIVATEEEMEDIIPEQSFEMLQQTFISAATTGMPPVKIRKTVQTAAAKAHDDEGRI